MAPVKYEKASQGKNDGYKGFSNKLNKLFSILFPIFQPRQSRDLRHSNIPLFHYSTFDIQLKLIFEKNHFKHK